jgi:hypothetical protein
MTVNCSNQKVQRGANTLLDLSYNYLRAGTSSGRTGHLTKNTNNLDSGRERGYEYRAGKVEESDWRLDHPLDANLHL